MVRAEDLGPYLLGQLDPAEAARVAEAVTSCASCTAEVQALRPVVVALAYAGPPLDESAAQAPDPALERVLSSVHEERRAQHRRWRTRVYLAAAAVVLLAAAAVGGVVTLRSDSGQREVVLSGATSAAGTADVSAKAWGTAITLKVQRPAAGQVLRRVAGRRLRQAGRRRQLPAGRRRHRPAGPERFAAAGPGGGHRGDRALPGPGRPDGPPGRQPRPRPLSHGARTPHGIRILHDAGRKSGCFTGRMASGSPRCCIGRRVPTETAPRAFGRPPRPARGRRRRP